MYTTKQVQQTVTVVEDVFCNKCKKKMNTQYHEEGTRLDASFGYGSNKDDLQEYFHLCDDCYDAIVATFLIPPTQV